MHGQSSTAEESGEMGAIFSEKVVDPSIGPVIRVYYRVRLSVNVKVRVN